MEIQGSSHHIKCLACVFLHWELIGFHQWNIGNIDGFHSQCKQQVVENRMHGSELFPFITTICEHYFYHRNQYWESLLYILSITLFPTQQLYQNDKSVYLHLNICISYSIYWNNTWIFSWEFYPCGENPPLWIRNCCWHNCIALHSNTDSAGLFQDKPFLHRTCRRKTYLFEKKETRILCSKKYEIRI